MILFNSFVKPLVISEEKKYEIVKDANVFGIYPLSYRGPLARL
jgi:hypothetical protein